MYTDLSSPKILVASEMQKKHNNTNLNTNEQKPKIIEHYRSSTLISRARRTFYTLHCTNTAHCRAQRKLPDSRLPTCMIPTE